MLNVLKKIFGDKHEKNLKLLWPVVDEINQEYEKLKQLSDDELRAKTQEFRDKINEYTAETRKQIDELKEKLQSDEDFDRNVAYDELNALEEKLNEEYEEILNQILPEAFAVVKSTCERLVGKTWIVAGNKLKWEMLHYDVQLIGGVVLHQGKIAEMATGEGKTLVATLPAFLNALAKRGVHIVTVNNYLATRDCEWMGPLFEFHGLSVDCIDKYEPNSDARRKAYACDITYGTNNEFGFDYLRDNMSREVEELVQRKHHFAMVDEVDSVLIDDARTPLIISGPVPKGDEHQFHDLKPRIQLLVDAQKKVVSQFLIDAKKFIKDGSDKDAGLPLFRAFRGLPKYKPLIKFLSEPGMKIIQQKTENIYLQDNSKMMPEADEALYFTIDEKNNSIELTEKGIDLITGQGEDSSFFIMPDIGSAIADYENDKSLSEHDMLKKKEVLIQEYAEKSDRIHTINQLLKAYTLFEKDTEYILVDGKVKIVDEQTGRVMEGPQIF